MPENIASVSEINYFQDNLSYKTTDKKKQDDLRTEKYTTNSNDSYEADGNSQLKVPIRDTDYKSLLQKGGKPYQNRTDNAQNESGTQTKTIKSTSDEQTIQELKKRDTEVKSHENAHRAAGGSLIAGATAFNYTTGPDGKQYVIGGEVSIDISAVEGNPEATIEKMEQVRLAALAPPDPSPQDRSVAMVAASKEATARRELMRMQSSQDAQIYNLNVQAINKYENSVDEEVKIGKNIDLVISTIVSPATLKKAELQDSPDNSAKRT